MIGSFSRRFSEGWKAALLLLPMLGSLASGQYLDVARIALTADVRYAATTLGEQTFYQGDSVTFDLVSLDHGAPMDLSLDGISVLWTAHAMTNLDLTYISSTGSLVAGTSNHMQFALEPAASRIQAQRYLSLVAAYQNIGGTNRYIRTLCRTALKVLWAPDVDDIDLVPPMSNTIYVRHAQMGEGAIWDGTNWTFGVSTSTVDATARAWAVGASNRAEEAYSAAEAADSIGTAAYALAAGAATQGHHHVLAEIDDAGTMAAQEAGNYYTAVESDSRFLRVPLGGAYYRDFFTLDFLPEGYTTTATGAIMQGYSIYYRVDTIAGLTAWTLSPTIARLSDWSNTIVWEVESGGTISNNVFQFDPGAETGDVAYIIGTLGAFSQRFAITNPAPEWTSDRYVFEYDRTGSLRRAINTNLAAYAARTNMSVQVFTPGAAGGWTNAQTRNTNCWIYPVDLTSASYWNSSGGCYYAGTLITPQHAVLAKHFQPPVGAVFRWMDLTNGVHERTLTAKAQINGVNADIALCLFDSPLPDAITPAQVLDADDLGRIADIGRCMPACGLSVVWLDQAERAYYSYINTPTDLWRTIDELGIWPREGPFARTPVGGDSGNPLLMVHGTMAILGATYHGPFSGPNYTRWIDEIEAAMAALGGSVYTNATRFGASAYTDYTVPGFP